VMYYVAHLGVVGLSVATAIAANVMALALLIIMAKRRRGFINKELLLNAAKVATGGFFLFLAAWVVYNLIPWQDETFLWLLIRLVAAAAAGGCAYLVVCGILKVKEQSRILGMLLRR